MKTFVIYDKEVEGIYTFNAQDRTSALAKYADFWDIELDHEDLDTLIIQEIEHNEDKIVKVI